MVKNMQNVRFRTKHNINTCDILFVISEDCFVSDGFDCTLTCEEGDSNCFIDDSVQFNKFNIRYIDKYSAKKIMSQPEYQEICNSSCSRVYEIQVDQDSELYLGNGEYIRYITWLKCYN